MLDQGKKDKVYEHTVVRAIEYFDNEADTVANDDSSPDTDVAEPEETLNEQGDADV